MAFTSKLGTAESYLGNIELGIGGTPSGNYDDSLSIDGVCDITINQLFAFTLTIDGVSDCDVLDGFRYLNTLQLDGEADFTILDGTSFQNSVTVDGFAATTIFAADFVTLAIDGIADITPTGLLVMRPTQTVDGVSAITLSPQYSLLNTITIAGIGDFFSPGGVVLLNNLAIEGIADIARLAGFGFNETFDIDGIADITILELTVKLLELSIDGVADCVTETLQNGHISLTVGGVAALTIDNNFSYVITLSIAGISTIYQGSALNAGGDDGLHNFMALTSNDTIDVSSLRFTPGNQNPSSAGNVSVACTGIFNRTVTQTLSITQLAQIKKPTEIIDTFHIVSQVVTVQRVRIRTATNTIVFTHDAEAYRAFAQSLNFAQTAIASKVISRTVTQSLNLTQTANRTTVLNRTFTQTLVMGQNRLVRTPIIGTIGSSNPTGFEYYQPVARAILVPSRCLVVLGVPSQTIILPCPQFGDTQSLGDTINLKRTMTGDTFTYVRRTELQKLKYTFQMGTYKAIELQQFLLDHCHEIITLINHKGETWYVNLSNNPFEFSVAERWQKKGERHDITLEFEGVKL